MCVRDCERKWNEESSAFRQTRSLSRRNDEMYVHRDEIPEYVWNADLVL